MKMLWVKIGIAIFWIGWPLIWLKLRKSRRTRVLVVCNQEILVVKTWIGDGKWSFPGGGLHRGETTNQGAKRELAEETGIKLPPKEFRKLDDKQDGFRGLSFIADRFVVNLSKKPSTKPQLPEIIDISWLPIGKSTDRLLRSDAQEMLEVWRREPNLLP